MTVAAYPNGALSNGRTQVIKPTQFKAGDAAVCCERCGHETPVLLPSLRDVLLRGQVATELPLTITERLVFEALHAVTPSWLTSYGLDDAVWGGDICRSTLKTHIFHMRRKLVGSGWAIETKAGMYRLRAEAGA